MSCVRSLVCLFYYGPTDDDNETRVGPIIKYFQELTPPIYVCYYELCMLHAYMIYVCCVYYTVEELLVPV